MTAKIKAHRDNRGDSKRYVSRIRAGVSVALLGVLLGACSSVPNAVNPVKWYEKTTNFFSGDVQAAKNTSTSTQNPEKTKDKGVSADAKTPTPVVAVADAANGLNADDGSGRQYAPSLKRQGAARDVLQPEEETKVVSPQVPAPQVSIPAPQVSISAPQAQAPQVSAPQPPAPRAQPTVQVMPAPVDVPPREASAPREGPLPYVASVPPSVPPRPAFSARSTQAARAPANATSPFGGEPFKTVVISADGLDTPPPASQPAGKRDFKFKELLSTTKPQGALFPKPGETVQRDASPDRIGGMLRVATIHFANNSDRLDGRDRSILGAVVQLQRERGGRVVVVGHASQRTRDMNYIRHQMVNFKISMERADTVGNALEAMGLRSKSLEVQAVSDAKPLYLEVMPSGEAGNRRVEVYLAP